MNKLSRETKLFSRLFKLTQLGKFELALIYRKLKCVIIDFILHKLNFNQDQLYCEAHIYVFQNEANKLLTKASRIFTGQIQSKILTPLPMISFLLQFLYVCGIN